MAESDIRVVVVGGGIVGVFAAHALAERGTAVTVLESARLASGTTAASFAWLNATSKDEDAAYHHLNADGLARHVGLAAACGEARYGLFEGGMLTWAAPHEAEKIAALRARYERLRALGYPVCQVGQETLRLLEPRLDPAPGAEGIHAFADRWLDAPRAVAALTGRLRALGVEIRENTPAERLDVDGVGSVCGVLAGGESFPAERVVVAAGHRTPQTLAALLDDAGLASRFPLRGVPGVLVTTPADPERRWVRRVVYATEKGELHLQPVPGGALVLGAEDLDARAGPTPDDTTRREVTGEMLDRARSYLPGVPAWRPEECRLRIGVRPMPADGVAIAGPLPDIAGVHVAVTHSGVTLAPALGAAIAEEIVTGRRSSALAPFGLDRFARQPPTAEAAS